MARRHYLERVGDDGQRIYLDGNTHIGRSDRIHDYGARPIPEVFKKARLAVCIEDQGHFISRNHAILEMRNGAFCIYDLNSLNGTDVKGSGIECVFREVDSLEGRVLNPGDTIRLGGHTGFVYGIDATSSKNFALLVANDGGNLRGVVNDADAMKNMLESRGFEGNVEMLVNGNATEDNVLCGLNRLKALASGDSLSVFYFSGHGSKDGAVLLGSNPLKFNEIYGFLDEVRGKKLVVVDSCYSGKALENIPSDTLVITSAGKYQEAYEDYSSVHTPGLFNEYRVFGNFTKHFLKLVGENPGNLNLKEMREKLGESYKLRQRGQCPNLGGVTVILRTQVGK